MTQKRKVGRPARTRVPSIRATASFPPEIYRILEALAKQKRVSVAWVLRDAAQQYVAAQWPLLEK
jgi:predicted transcriptional regulator